MFPTTILLATDGSEEASRAAKMATRLSQTLDSELHIVNVGAMPSVYSYPEAAIPGPEYARSPKKPVRDLRSRWRR